MAIVQTMLLGAVGALFYYLLLGIGNKSMAGLMRAAAVMAVIAVVAPAVWGFIVDVKASIDGFWERVDSIVNKVTFWR
jgi:hypothetical protein